MYTYRYMYVYTYIYVDTYAQIDSMVCMQYAYTYIYVLIFIHLLSVCFHLLVCQYCTYVCMYVCMYVWMDGYLYQYLYLYIYIFGKNRAYHLQKQLGHVGPIQTYAHGRCPYKNPRQVRPFLLDKKELEAGRPEPVAALGQNRFLNLASVWGCWKNEPIAVHAQSPYRPRNGVGICSTVTCFVRLRSSGDTAAC